MVQPSPVTSISERYNDISSSGKEMLYFLQLIRGWKPDRMNGMSSDAFGLEDFKDSV